jgi:hypothetical protein
MNTELIILTFTFSALLFTIWYLSNELGKAIKNSIEWRNAFISEHLAHTTTKLELHIKEMHK